MAAQKDKSPIGNTKPVDEAIYDDDDKWTDLVENVRTPSPIPKPEDIKLGIPPPVSSSRPQPPPPFVRPMPPPGYNYPPPPAKTWGTPYHPVNSPVDPNSYAKLEQMRLESELMLIAECKLGLLNASEILYRELTVGTTAKSQDQSQVPPPKRNLPYYHAGPGAPSGISSIPYLCFTNEKNNNRELVKNFGYLLGLERAIKLLNDALADENRVNLTYSFKTFSMEPMGPLVPPVNPVPPMIYPPVPSVTGPDEKWREATKDIVKQSLSEYKKEAMSGVEEIQKEMIKLCRDVSIHAMNKH